MDFKLARNNIFHSCSVRRTIIFFTGNEKDYNKLTKEAKGARNITAEEPKAG
jgi:hypothetical protein